MVSLVSLTANWYILWADVVLERLNIVAIDPLPPRRNHFQRRRMVSVSDGKPVVRQGHCTRCSGWRPDLDSRLPPDAAASNAQRGNWR